MATWFDIMETTGRAEISANTEIPAVAAEAEPDIADVPDFVLTHKLFGDILALRKSVENIEKALDDSDDTDDVSELLADRDAFLESIDFMNWQLGHHMGYECLAELRKLWGIQISMHNALQERYYKAQKSRYEECKRGKKFFTSQDRAFIEQNKLLNELHMEARWKASHCREVISDMIEAAFPNAPFDVGWDEDWVEA
jgi:hypothetical protein